MDKAEFDYKWTLKDAKFTKDKGKVFSCFACGGGSTMGYKLAGFDVIGCNEIDPRMAKIYQENHNPKYCFIEGIQTFKLRDDLPEELYNLDILDGSPPCSSFSMAGNRDKDWGKEKVFSEGQALQVLDTLFFDFIDLAKELQPKVVIAENVKGLLLGNAIEYVDRIYKEFDEAGYYCQHFLLNAADMGVPQARERVFFICLRKDLAEPFLDVKNLFEVEPKINMEFNCKHVLFKEVRCVNGNKGAYLKDTTQWFKLWKVCSIGKSLASVHPTGAFFNDIKVAPDKVCNTLTAAAKLLDCYEPRRLFDEEMIAIGSFPSDYNFMKQRTGYVIGMSVPPLMTANIASMVYKQWLSKI